MNLSNSETAGITCSNWGKYSIFFLLLLLISFGGARAQKLINYKDSCSSNTARPLQLKMGDKVLIGCDTAYLINAYRYRIYEKAKDYLLNLGENTNKLTFSQLEGRLNQLDTYFTEIQSRYFILSDELKKTQTENIAVLEKVKKELDQAKAELLLTRNDLEIIKESLNRARKKNIRNRLIYGGVGLGAGILLGAVFLK